MLNSSREATSIPQSHAKSLPTRLNKSFSGLWLAVRASIGFIVLGLGLCVIFEWWRKDTTRHNTSHALGLMLVCVHYWIKILAKR